LRPDYRQANQTRLACNEGKKSSPPLKFLTALKVEMFISGALGMEVELYRASDGSHLGAFSHETGIQVGPIRKNRNIKKYL
jgi:hypothetical protein